MKFNTKEERDNFIMENIGLVDSIIRKRIRHYDYVDYTYDDVKSMGIIGLITAVDRYDENRGCNFSTYAYVFIMGEILSRFRSVRRGIRYGRKILTNKNKITEMLTYKTEKEVAEELNLTIDEVHKINSVDFSSFSLNCEPLGKSEKEVDKEYINILSYEVDFNKNLFWENLLECLSKRDRNILLKFMIGGYSQTEISKEVGVSQVQVGRIIKKSLNKLKEVA